MIQAAIFDFDGTLFDSMFVWDMAGASYLRAIGKEPAADLPHILKPMSLQQAADYLKERYSIPLAAEDIMAGINHTVEDFYLHTIAPKPGVVAFLEELHRKGVRMCIATATDRHQVEAALVRCGMQHFFSGIFTCTEVGSGKDRPLIYRKAMEHLGTARSNTVVVEDAWHAIRTAKQDGFSVVAVYDSHESMQSSVRGAADVYLTDYSFTEPFWKFASAASADSFGRHIGGTTLCRDRKQC